MSSEFKPGRRLFRDVCTLRPQPPADGSVGRGFRLKSSLVEHLGGGARCLLMPSGAGSQDERQDPRVEPITEPCRKARRVGSPDDTL
eukprot:5402857-Alexandrium_andersonii.AAC.1